MTDTPKTTATSYVIDAMMGCRDGMFCFCPVEGNLDGDFTIIIGMNYLSDQPPKGGRFVAVVHEDGQEAVELFCEQFSAELTRMHR